MKKILLSAFCLACALPAVAQVAVDVNIDKVTKVTERPAQQAPLPDDFLIANFTSNYFQTFLQNLKAQGLDDNAAQLMTEAVRNQMNMPAWRYKVLLCLKGKTTRQALHPQTGCFADFASEANMHLQTLLVLLK